MKTLQLSNSTDLAIIDDNHYERLVVYSWRYVDAISNKCVCNCSSRTIKHYTTDGKFIKATREFIRLPLSNAVMSDFTGQIYDHKDRNPLNNLESNLRKANYHQNQCNRGKTLGCSSDYKGVCFHKRNKKWRAYIKVKRKPINLGTFDSEIDAAKAYNEAAIKFHGEFAVLNQIK